MPEFATAQDAMGFVVDQTYRINAEVMSIEYPEYDYASLVPVNAEGPKWSSGIYTFVTDSAGQARWYAGGADDMPVADVKQLKTEASFEMGGIGYEFNLEEVNKAALIPGMNLTNRKADAARAISEQFIYNIALYGDATKNMAGLFNSAAVTSGLVANNAGATSRLWVNKTPAEILLDVNTLLTGINTNSGYVEFADTLALPIERMNYLGQTVMSATNSETILSFLMRTNTYTLQTGKPLTMRGVRGLLTLGAGSTARMAAYRRDPRVVRFHLPMPHEFMPVWQNGPTNFLVPGMFRLGGCEFLRPAAFRYGDGF